MSRGLMTIGQLARRTGVSTSLLRYYEKEDLITPTDHSEAGYRLYADDVQKTIEFIKAAKRYGFSLTDIKGILGKDSGGERGDAEIMSMAEERFMDIERRVTEMLVLRHELELFLFDLASQLDLHGSDASDPHYRELVEQVCGHDITHMPKSSLQRLTERIGCRLASSEWEALFKDLRGRHVHIWRDDDQYAVQFTPKTDKVEAALQRLADSESDCDVHVQPQVSESENGLLFTAKGENAFLYAKLFLALESAEA